MSFLSLLLIALGIHFKHLEIASANLNLYLVPLSLGIAAIALCFCTGKRTRSKVKLVRTPGVFLLGIVGVGLLQDTFTDHPPEFHAVLIYLMGFIIFYTTLLLLQFSKLEFPRVFKCLTLVSLLSTALLILQTGVSTSFDSVPFFSKIGLISDQVGDITEIVEVRGRGLARSIIDYAIHNFIPFFWCFYSLRYGRSLRRIRYLFLFSILVIGALISDTDGFTVGILAALGVYAIEKLSAWRRVSFAKIAGGTCALAALIFFGIPYIATAAIYAESAVSSSIVARLYLWSSGLSMFVDRPWSGVGLGKFSDFLMEYQPYLFVNYQHPAVSAHSWLFDFLATGGLPALVFFAAFMFMTYREARYSCRVANTITDRVLFLSFVGYLAMGLFGNIHLFTLDYYFISAFIHSRYLDIRSNETQRAQAVYQSQSTIVPGSIDSGHVSNFR